MRNSKKIKEASVKVFSKLFAMDAEDLNNKLAEREIGPIAQAFIVANEPSCEQYYVSYGYVAANFSFDTLHSIHACLSESVNIPVYSCLNIWSATMTSDSRGLSYVIGGEEDSWQLAA